MSKIRNKTRYSDDQGYLKFLAEELDFIGREYLLNLKEGYITQYALPQRHKKSKDKKKDDKKPARRS